MSNGILPAVVGVGGKRASFPTVTVAALVPVGIRCAWSARAAVVPTPTAPALTLSAAGVVLDSAAGALPAVAAVTRPCASRVTEAGYAIAPAPGPVFGIEIAIEPPSATTPPSVSPAPAVTVIELLMSAAFAISEQELLVQLIVIPDSVVDMDHVGVVAVRTGMPRPNPKLARAVRSALLG